ncbi:DinB family protein [Nocardioides sp.]|uniref:DinB family protein n=1 Tax=Nocardioides sp. TaxID=35761 RepID=UPI002C661FC4|nr:DinB family protein [Nocardioides sp.]HXH77689.1 DinB family protein [Nocardioides sp.]
MAEEIRGRDFAGAQVRDSTFNGASFRDSDLRGVTIRASWVEGMHVDGPHGEVQQVFVNGIDVSPYVTSELDRLFPERVAVRSVSTAADRRTVWARLEGLWDETLERDSAVRDVSVGGEWSLRDTVRHLVFADDCWTGQMLLGGGPFHPWGLPNTDYPSDRVRADLGIDVSVDVPFDELVVLHRERRSRFGALLAGLSDGDLATERTGTPAPACGEETHTVADCIDTLLREHSEHRRFIERDLRSLDEEA